MVLWTACFLFCRIWHTASFVCVLGLQLEQGYVVIFAQIKVICLADSLLFVWTNDSARNDTFLEVETQRSDRIVLITKSGPQIWKAVWRERYLLDSRSSLFLRKSRMNLSSLLKVLGHLRHWRWLLWQVLGRLLGGEFLLLVTDQTQMHRFHLWLLVTWTTSGPLTSPQIVCLISLLLKLW